MSQTTPAPQGQGQGQSGQQGGNAESVLDELRKKVREINAQSQTNRLSKGGKK
jgi:hypothetical protein